MVEAGIQKKQREFDPGHGTMDQIFTLAET